MVKRQRAALTRAVKSRDPGRVVLAACDAVRAWDQPGAIWPDTWADWQRALDDALPRNQAIQLEDLRWAGDTNDPAAILAAARAAGDAALRRQVPVDYDALNHMVRSQQQTLDAAVASGDPAQVILAVRDAVLAWDQPGAIWPDTWARWQTALDNALPGRQIDIHDLARAAAVIARQAGLATPAAAQPPPAAGRPGPDSQDPAAPGTAGAPAAAAAGPAADAARPAGGPPPAADEHHDAAPSAPERPQPGQLTSADLAAALRGFPPWAFAELACHGSRPESGQRRDSQPAPGPSRYTRWDPKGVHHSVTEPGAARTGTVTWEQAGRWIGTGMTADRLRLLLEAGRLFFYYAGTQTEMTRAGQQDAWRQGLDETITILRTLAAEVTSAAADACEPGAPIPADLPEDRSYRTESSQITPSQHPVLRRLGELRSRVQDVIRRAAQQPGAAASAADPGAPLTAAEIRHAIRMWIGPSSLPEFARAMAGNEPMRAWINAQIAQVGILGRFYLTYDDPAARTGQQEHRVDPAPDGLVMLRGGLARREETIAWEQLSAWLEGGLTEARRAELTQAADALAALTRHKPSGADTGPPADAQQAEELQARLNRAVDEAWEAIDAAPPPTAAQLDASAATYRDMSPVQGTLFTDQPAGSGPSPGGPDPAGKHPGTAAGMAAGGSAEPPQVRDAGLFPASPGPEATVTGAPAGQAGPGQAAPPPARRDPPPIMTRQDRQDRAFRRHVDELHAAVDVLAALPGHAATADGPGFTQDDTYLGMFLADLPAARWGNQERIAAWHMLARYDSQLAEAGVSYAGLRPPPGVQDMGAAQFTAVRETATGRMAAWWPGLLRDRLGPRFVRCDAPGSAVMLGHDPADTALAAEAAQIPGARGWIAAAQATVFPFSCLADVVALAGRHGIPVTGDVQSLAMSPAAGPAAGQAVSPAAAQAQDPAGGRQARPAPGQAAAAGEQDSSPAAGDTPPGDTAAGPTAAPGGCTVCGQPLDPVLPAAGFATHPGCDPGEQPGPAQGRPRQAAGPAAPETPGPPPASPQVTGEDLAIALRRMAGHEFGGTGPGRAGPAAIRRRCPPAGRASLMRVPASGSASRCPG